MEINIKKLHPRAITPTYATDGSACFDLYAIIDNLNKCETVSINKPHTFSTGIAFEIPAGWVMRIYSRSGHGFNRDTRLANCVGIIDSDYRGEVKVKLTNDSIDGLLVINNGDRIAQAEITPMYRAEFIEVDDLSETTRGAGGFGSTGK